MALIYWRTLKTHHHIFALFLQTVYAIEKLLAGFNVQPRIGMNQSFYLTALSRDALFLQTVYAIEKLLAGFNVQPRIGMNQSFYLTALSRNAADDVTWVHTASSTFLHS